MIVLPAALVLTGRAGACRDGGHPRSEPSTEECKADQSAQGSAEAKVAHSAAVPAVLPQTAASGATGRDHEHTADGSHPRMPSRRMLGGESTAQLRTAWEDDTVLHCAYELAPSTTSTVLSVAWSDSAGELLQHATQHLHAPCEAAGTPSKLAAARLSWQAALAVLKQTAALLQRIADAGVTTMSHACVLLSGSMREHAWPWMQLPLLLREAEEHGCIALPALSRVTALLLMVDCGSAAAQQARPSFPVPPVWRSSR